MLRARLSKLKVPICKFAPDEQKRFAGKMEFLGKVREKKPTFHPIKKTRLFNLASNRGSRVLFDPVGRGLGK